LRLQLRHSPHLHAQLPVDVFDLSLHGSQDLLPGASRYDSRRTRLASRSSRPGRPPRTGLSSGADRSGFAGRTGRSLEPALTAHTS
jgi:hypothetical protein